MRLPRYLRPAIYSVLAVALALYVLLPVGFGAFASMRRPAAVGDPPAGFEEVMLTADDGTRLAAWYAPTRNGAAIILLHGAGDSREDVRAQTQMLTRSGFGVLALDLRGHGESGGDGNSFCWECTQDVAAAVAYLRDEKGITALGGMGTSLGGETLLGAISSQPDLRAVVSDGATQRTIEDYLVLPSRRSLAHSWTTRVMYASVRVFSGERPPATLLASIREADGTALLLIAAGEEADESAYAAIFLAAAGGRAQSWTVPDVEHTDAFSTRPQEYESRVVGFFNATLLP